jgi:hypothetical protein
MRPKTSPDTLYAILQTPADPTAQAGVTAPQREKSTTYTQSQPQATLYYSENETHSFDSLSQPVLFFLI